MPVNIKIIECFDDFCSALRTAGFCMGGGNNEGIFSLSKYFSPNLKWFSGEKDVDPWEWRIMVLQELDNKNKDIVYSKLFFSKGGFITKEYYKYFYILRRKYKTFNEAYECGAENSYAKKIYDAVEQNGRVAYHNIKYLCSFDKEDNGRVEKAITDLQMKMYITMCGNERKRSFKGEEYGWPSAVFCKCEDFFGEEYFKDVFDISRENDKGIDRANALDMITAQIYNLNPDADMKNINRFIKMS